MLQIDENYILATSRPKTLLLLELVGGFYIMECVLPWTSDDMAEPKRLRNRYCHN